MLSRAGYLAEAGRHLQRALAWDLVRPMRHTAEFRRLVDAVGLEQLWRSRGWPDKCRPKEAGDFVCD